MKILSKYYWLSLFLFLLSLVSLDLLSGSQVFLEQKDLTPYTAAENTINIPFYSLTVLMIASRLLKYA